MTSDVMLRYGDLILIVLAAPILLLTGAPAIGYGIGGATWIALRLLGRAVEHHASAARDLSELVALSVGYRFARVLLLVLAVVLAEKMVGKHDGLAALLAIVGGFTVQLCWSIAHHLGSRPRTRAANAHGREA